MKIDKNDIAVYGGSFSPPGNHHVKVVEVLIEAGFRRIIVVPCGYRDDKKTRTNDIEKLHRAVMSDMAFGHLPGVEVDLFDLEKDVFTRTWDLERRYKNQGRVWHVIGADMIIGGRAGESEIQREWEHGRELWNKSNFVVFTRDGYNLLKEDLPPHNVVMTAAVETAKSSTEIRRAIAAHESIADMTPPLVTDYIERYRLYSAGLTVRSGEINIHSPRLLIISDPDNLRAQEIARYFSRFACPQKPNMILVVGGDGTMLRAVRENWRKRLPFFGINAGHLGFLLNRIEALPEEWEDVFVSPFVVHQSPLLYVETRKHLHDWKGAFAVNDAWVERQTLQAAWIELIVRQRANGHVTTEEWHLDKLVGNGALVSTAAGSTSYAQPMGAPAMLVGSPHLVLVGDDVKFPANWEYSTLDLNQEVEMVGLDGKKRPLRGSVDGVDLGRVQAMRVRTSNIAAAEFVFVKGQDLAGKLEEIQFPGAISSSGWRKRPTTNS
ncbi:MAG: NAD(+)/NADH kinase [Patescibacteria group bacterium]|jgi:nicotinic acid mononucleotide adenylyltransferase